MAASSVQCPQCEKRVEVRTAPAHLRECPECGTALGGQSVSGFAALPEDAFDRMRLDPALAAVRRKFLLGVAAVAGLVVLVVVADHLRDSRPVEPPKAPPRVVTAEPVRPIEHLKPVFAAGSLEERMGKVQPQAELRSSPAVRETEKLAAPVFELSDGSSAPKPLDQGTPQVFEVSDLPAIVAPGP